MRVISKNLLQSLAPDRFVQSHVLQHGYVTCASQSVAPAGSLETEAMGTEDCQGHYRGPASTSNENCEQLRSEASALYGEPQWLSAAPSLAIHCTCSVVMVRGPVQSIQSCVLFQLCTHALLF